MNALRDAFVAVLEGRSLERSAAMAAFSEMFDGDSPDALAAGFLVALRIRRETAEELAGAASVMMARAKPANLGTVDLLDTCGTGGDGSNSFNVSTGAAILAAAAGIRVAKHGNRAMSGSIGAADLLEGCGVKIDLDRDGLLRCLNYAGICFVFAPAYHPAMKRFSELRRALGVRTIFNLLGPLSNPARPVWQLMGVAEASMVRPMAEALRSLGGQRAMVVHGRDGLDEISIGAPTRVVEIRSDSRELLEFELKPEDFGIACYEKDAMRVAGREQAVEMLKAALAGTPGAAFDALVLNGGAALYLGGRAATLKEGTALARATLRGKRGLDTMERLRQASHRAP